MQSISWEEEVMDLLEVMGLKVDSMVYMVIGLLFRKEDACLVEGICNLKCILISSSTKDTFK